MMGFRPRRWRPRLTGPPGAAGPLLYVGVALLAVMVVIAIATNPVVLVLQAAAVAAGLFGPRWLAHRRLTNDVFQRTRKITRDEEYEADIAQDRRRVPAFLRGDWRMLVFRTHWENVRKSVRPSKYVRVEFERSIEGMLSSPLRAWWPRRDDVVVVTRRWPPIFEPYHGPPGQSGLERLYRQVAAFFGYGRVADLDDEDLDALRKQVADGGKRELLDPWRELTMEELERKVRVLKVDHAGCFAMYAPVPAAEAFDHRDGDGYGDRYGDRYGDGYDDGYDDGGDHTHG